jgi:hypothetical protein
MSLLSIGDGEFSLPSFAFDISRRAPFVPVSSGATPPPTGCSSRARNVPGDRAFAVSAFPDHVAKPAEAPRTFAFDLFQPSVSFPMRDHLTSV